MDVAKRLLAALDESAAWFYAPGNRDALIQMGMKHFKIEQGEAAQSLDFLRKIQYFAPDSKVSQKGLDSLIQVMHASGDVSSPITAKDLTMPGLTELSE
jgi:ABC-type nitrate/sulfonate/bicarbonate transport system substrate-binding protein